MTINQPNEGQTPQASRPRYEKPTVLPLGEVAKGQGIPACNNGSGQTFVCQSGSTAGTTCNNGVSV